MTLIFTDPIFLEHETGRHPESPARLKSITEHLERTQLLSRVTTGKIRTASKDELTLVHDDDYIQEIVTVTENGGGRLDPDTVACPASFRVASQAAGTTFAAVDEVTRIVPLPRRSISGQTAAARRKRPSVPRRQPVSKALSDVSFNARPPI